MEEEVVSAKKRKLSRKALAISQNYRTGRWEIWVFRPECPGPTPIKQLAVTVAHPDTKQEVLCRVDLPEDRLPGNSNYFYETILNQLQPMEQCDRRIVLSMGDQRLPYRSVANAVAMLGIAHVNKLVIQAVSVPHPYAGSDWQRCMSCVSCGSAPDKDAKSLQDAFAVCPCNQKECYLVGCGNCGPQFAGHGHNALLAHYILRHHAHNGQLLLVEQAMPQIRNAIDKMRQ